MSGDVSVDGLSLLAIATDVGVIHVDLPHTGIVEPVLTASTLDVLAIGIGRHHAQTGLLPILRRRLQPTTLLIETCPREVVVVVGGLQLRVLLIRQHETLAFDGVDVEAEGG